jgi:hypothetical protein
MQLAPPGAIQIATLTRRSCARRGSAGQARQHRGEVSAFVAPLPPECAAFRVIHADGSVAQCGLA